MKRLIIGLLVFAVCASVLGQGTEPTEPPKFKGSGGSAIINKTADSVGFIIGSDTAWISAAGFLLKAAQAYYTDGTGTLQAQFKSSNATDARVSILNTGSGDAILFFDAANGDLAGSDYVVLGQFDDSSFFFEIKGSASYPYFEWLVGGSQKLKLTATGLTFGGSVPGTDFTFPLTDGSVDQALVTDGSGSVTWQNQAGGGTTDSVYWKRTDSSGSDRWLTPEDTIWHDTITDTASFATICGTTQKILITNSVSFNTAGSIAYDSGDGRMEVTWETSNLVNFYPGKNADSIRGLSVQDTTGNIADNYILKYDAGTDSLVWVADEGAGGALTYFTEADDNDTSVFTATAPNTTVGFNDDLTMQGHNIKGLLALTMASVLTGPTQILSPGHVGETFGLYLNQGGEGVKGHIWSWNSGSASGMSIEFDSLGNEIEFSDQLNVLDNDITGVNKLTADTVVSPLIIGGTGTTSDLNLQTTIGVGASGADMHFLVGNDGGTEAITILNNGNVGIGTISPNAPLEIEGPNVGDVGGFSAGILQVTGTSASQFTPVVITGHNSYNGNTQLWYLGSMSSANDDIVFINRQNASLSLFTNDTERLKITNTGNVGIGNTSPQALTVVGNIATGDTTTGDVDVFHYFSTDGSWTTEYFKWDDGLSLFQISDDLDLQSNDMFSIDSADIDKYTDGSIDLPDLAGNSVNSSKIVDQSIVGDDVDSTAENFVFSAAFRGTSAEADSSFMTKKYIDDAAGGLTDQSVKGDHVDSVGEDFVFDDAYRGTSAEADSAYATEYFTKTIAGDSAQLRLLLAGGTMSGDIAMGSQDITGADSVDITKYTDGSIDPPDLADADFGAFTVSSGVATIDAGAVTFNDLRDPTDTTKQSFGTKGVLWNFTNATDFDGSFEFNITGNSSNDGFHIHQHTGNPTAGHLIHAQSEDPDMIPFCAFSGNDTVVAFGQSGGALTSSIDTAGVFHGDLEADTVIVADLLKLPTADDPTTATEGEIAWDANDDAIEVYSGDEGESVLIPIYGHISAPLVLPDSVAVYAPNLIIFKCNALRYPFGIEIDLVSIQLGADAAYTMVIEEWTSADPPSLDNVISTVTTGSSDTYAEEAPDNHAAIEAGNRIVLNIPSTNVDYVTVEIFFHIMDGD